MIECTELSLSFAQKSLTLKIGRLHISMLPIPSSIYPIPQNTKGKTKCCHFNGLQESLMDEVEGWLIRASGAGVSSEGVVMGLLMERLH